VADGRRTSLTRHFGTRVVLRVSLIQVPVRLGPAAFAWDRSASLSITPTQKLAASVDELIVGKLKSIGTVEGVLVTVSKRDGFRFYVEDRVRGKRVECHFREDLLATVLTAFDRRVIVRGVVWSRKDGEAQRIEVRSFEIVEEDAKLPRVREMRGILRGVEYGDD
jgi:hypothetical protein